MRVAVVNKYTGKIYLVTHPDEARAPHERSAVSLAFDIRQPVDAGTSSVIPVVPFKSIPVGKPFIFAAEVELPYSGIAKGPWVKIAPRLYQSYFRPVTTYRVGSINAEVIPGVM